MTFTYLPSSNAIHGTAAGCDIVVDFRAWNDGPNNRFGLIGTQAVDAANNLYDFWGNAPVNGVIPAAYPNAGLIWSCETDSLTPYRSPAMTSAVTAQLVDIMNAPVYGGSHMLTDWIGVMNQFLAAIYNAQTAPPPPGGGPFATWTDGAGYLSNLLTGYKLGNGQLVVK